MRARLGCEAALSVKKGNESIQLDCAHQHSELWPGEPEPAPCTVWDRNLVRYGFPAGEIRLWSTCLGYVQDKLPYVGMKDLLAATPGTRPFISKFAKVPLSVSVPICSESKLVLSFTSQRLSLELSELKQRCRPRSHEHSRVCSRFIALTFVCILLQSRAQLW